MTMKKFINKILDVPKLIRRIWLLLWVLLAILLVMKFCFGMWYPVVSNNEIFNSVCKFIDENLWSYKIMCFILYVFNCNILALTCLNKKKYTSIKMTILLNILFCIMSIIKIYNSLIGNILEVAVFFPLLILLNIKMDNFGKLYMNILLPIIIYAIINIWQFSIFLCRGLNLQELNTMPSLVLLILQIDYYIFLITNYLEVCFMGWAGIGWLWSKDITVLKAEKEKELKKEKPNMKKVETLDSKIAELEKEGK